MTPPETATYSCSDNPWDVRCFENLYPALKPPEGYHEVIVETARGDETFVDFTDEQMELMIEAYMDRFDFYARKDGISYISLFKNYGKEAGASIEHSHTQLIALPLMPPEIEKERKVIKQLDRCPYCSIIEEESNSVRKILDNEEWIAFSPFYSKTPFEVWILPKRHINNITYINSRQKSSFASIFRDVLRRLKVVLGDPPYNYHFMQTIGEDYHLNVRILPRISVAAGFELNTGIYILTVPPEDAATFLKDGGES
jgi:UDPglucose--hexose-1-phosphate uridylyltransferase